MSYGRYSALEKADKQYIWHPFTQMKDWAQGEPLIIAEGKGCYLKDIKGRVFLDGVSSLWVNIHGHRNPRLDRAVRQQLSRVAHSTFLGLTHPAAIELAEELVNIAPVGLTRVFYSDNGSTAVEAALKISYQYWQNLGKGEKDSFIYFDNSYHGDTLGAVAVGGIDLFHRIYRRLLFKAYRLPLALSRVEEFIKKRHSRIAAVIIEPLIQAAGGMLLAPQGFLRGLRRICSHYRVLLIADEVAVGFGRTGTMFACEQEAVRPDILCLAKGLSGGYLPLAATLTTEKIYAAFLERGRDKARCRPPGPKTFFHGHSYTANPLACAAALASLRIFRQQRVLEKLPAKIGLFNRCLRRFSALPCVKQVRHKGLIAGIDLDGDDDIGVKVIKEARRRGAILRPLGRVIVLMPPLSITNRELKRLLDITYHSILYRSKDAGEGR